MGRHKKLGDDICLSKKCPGYLKLGRYRTKKVRGRPSARFIEHPYFRHNDDIPEHYIDNATRRLWHNGNDSEAQLDYVYETLSHKLDRLCKTVDKYSLQEDERRQWLIGYNMFMKDVILPFSRLRLLFKSKRLSLMTGRALTPEIEEDLNRVKKWIKSGEMKKYFDSVTTAHPFIHQLAYLNNNYEYKKIRQRIEDRKESWKES